MKTWIVELPDDSMRQIVADEMNTDNPSGILAFFTGGVECLALNRGSWRTVRDSTVEIKRVAQSPSAAPATPQRRSQTIPAYPRK